MAWVGRTLAKAGLVRARSGNVSTRIGSGLAVTVAGSRLGALSFADILILDDLDSTHRDATSELALHAGIYSARPDVGAVIHTHSPYATAWSCVSEQLVLPLDEAGYYGMGPNVPLARYAPAGTRELADAATAALGDGLAVLLSRHGAVAVGPDLESAVCVAESLEHQAHVAWLLQRTSLGPVEQAARRREQRRLP
jgi:ribulose-5-phosphate 4-epimerase/fuculose-1-phosphate aldolase